MLAAAAGPETTSVSLHRQSSQLNPALLSFSPRKQPGVGPQDRLRGATAGPPR